jgi:hypothetical protein
MKRWQLDRPRERRAAPFTWNDAAFGLCPASMMKFIRFYIQQVDGVVADLQ